MTQAPREGLDDAQRRAVEHRDGPLAIVAGPGSGKTRVITHRIAHLVASGVAPESILAITFTNKAAEEMLERAHQLLGPLAADGAGRRPIISTFHSFCARVLRREIYHLEPYHTDFAIYDTTDQKSVVTEAVERLELEPRSFPAAGCLSWISRWKNEQVSPDEVCARVLRGAGTFREKRLAAIYERYQQCLVERNAVDFDDLLLLTLRLLQEVPAVLERRRRAHRYVLVDEFQDTNVPQYEIARLLCAEHRNLCITGDPDQSIYSWRGANPENFSNFRRHFAGAEEVLLSENYRSTPQIVTVASRLTGTAFGRRELHSGNATGAPVRVRAFDDERREARAVVQSLLEALADGTPLREMAVLYRTNALSRSLEEELIRRQLPYTVVGGVAFYQRKEVKDVLAYLRVAAFPRDDVAFRRIVNTPARGIGKVSLERFESEAWRRGLSLAGALEDDEVLQRIGAKRKAFVTLRELLRELREQRALGLARQVEWIVEHTGYRQHLERSEPETAPERFQNLEELGSAAAEIEEAVTRLAPRDGEEPVDALTAFLERIALVSDVDSWESRADRLVLMTLHAAKGLEFDHVIIVGVEDGLLPHSRSRDEGSEDEERRLLYVGATRARRVLELFHARWRRRFQHVEGRTPSPFLDEIEGDGLVREDLVRDEFGRGGGVTWERASDEWEEAGATSAWSSDEDGLRPGVSVDHEHLGRGVIERVTGFGSSRRLFIAFEEHGTKQILASIASLRVLGVADDA